MSENKRVLLGSGARWQKEMPFDGIVEFGMGACCGHNYIYVNGPVVGDCYDYTSYSNACYGRAYAKKGDIIKSASSQIAHPKSPSASWAYAYPCEPPPLATSASLGV